MEQRIKWEFLSAAIKIKLPDGSEQIFTGKRHHEIIKKINDAGLRDSYMKYHMDGFMLRYTRIRSGESDEIFKDRELSTEIAKLMNIPMESSILTSEDLIRMSLINEEVSRTFLQ